MTKLPCRAAIAAAAAAILSTGAPAQINVSGQASGGIIKSQGGVSQYTVDGGRATFDWRLDLFMDAEVTGSVVFLSNVRVEQDQDPRIDLLAIRVTDIAGPVLNLDAGLIDVPFGNLGERRFPRSNPFVSLPLGREHRTSLRSTTYGLWMADARYTAAGDGVRIIDGALYDAGVKIFGTAGILDYAAAITNGSVSATGSYAPGGLNDNHGFGKSARVALTPSTGLTIGVSASRGAFLPGGITTDGGVTYGAAADPAAHPQTIFGADLEFSHGHFTFYGEGFLNRWEFSDEYGEDLEASGFSGELRFVPAARFTLAARVGALTFSELPDTGAPGYYSTIPGTPWDRDVVRIEAAAGYRLSREVIVKAVYRRTDTAGLSGDPADDAAALQVVASF